MKRFDDLDAIDGAYAAYYDSASAFELAEEKAWAEFVASALIENEVAPS